MVRVLLAEDHGVVRDALRSLLETQPDLRVIAAVADGRQAVSETARLAPDVVVMDLSIPQMNGIEATRAIVAAKPATGVIIFSLHADEQSVRRALEAGARGYVDKAASGAEIIDAVRAVVSGGRHLTRQLAHPDAGGHQRPRAADADLGSLTRTEIEILKLVASGKSSAEIGSALGLSHRTIQTYRLRLMRKLGLEDLAALVKFAIRHGMAKLD